MLGDVQGSQLEPLTFNGIDATTGRYLLAPMTRRQLAERLGRRRPPASPISRGLIGDPLDLASAGWGVVLAPGLDRRTRDALEPLLSHRRQQAQAVDERRFRISELTAGETKATFLARHGVGRGPVDPRRMPYYLLLVGDLEALPFSFEVELATQHAVGRLALASAEDVARYAEGVVAAERGERPRSPVVDLIGPRNADDAATAVSTRELLEPLAARLEVPAGWRVALHRGTAASRDAYRARLADAEGAALMLSASHCLGFPCGHPSQAADQGAILCQDWPGPRQWQGPIDRGHYLAAGDLDDARVGGMMLFLFGCFSAGTPRFDDFAPPGMRRPLAPRPMVAALVQRLLGHPRGSALAVVGHLDRAWTYSIRWDGTDQTAVFEATLARLLAGHPVGHALEYFQQRYAELAVELAARHPGDGDAPDGLGTAAADARNYTLLGDPATRLVMPT